MGLEVRVVTTWPLFRPTASPVLTISRTRGERPARPSGKEKYVAAWCGCPPATKNPVELLNAMAGEQHDDAPDFFGTTFAIEDEDHTLANSLRFFLNKK